MNIEGGSVHIRYSLNTLSALNWRLAKYRGAGEGERGGCGASPARRTSAPSLILAAVALDLSNTYAGVQHTVPNTVL
jgi:hypothetical protein